MNPWQYIFWISCWIVFYNYAGYAIIVYFINIFSRKAAGAAKTDYFPPVSFIVAAFNEEDVIREKILNSLEQDYPSDKMEILFITDGSSDGTMDIIREYPAISLLHQRERKGKSAAINRVVENAKNEILIFSDANTILNKDAVKNIVRHYMDKKVGGVAGEKKVLSAASGPGKGGPDEVGAGEGLYWKYESFLKKLDSEFYSVVGAAGELFSVRKQLYTPVPDKVILDDFVISLKIAEKGYRFLYEPEAYAMELPSFSFGDEQKRKIRIAAGGFQAIGMLSSLLAFWRKPRLSFLYISHRVLRWTASPLCLVLAFISNGILSVLSPGYPYKILFLAQLAFYGMAFMARNPALKQRFKLLKLPYYFVFMNISVIQGFFRFLRGNQPAAWEKPNDRIVLPISAGGKFPPVSSSRNLL
jgi:biofilm PGA synthesis N-glycosyltransferase PgaC